MIESRISMDIVFTGEIEVIKAADVPAWHQTHDQWHDGCPLCAKETDE